MIDVVVLFFLLGVTARLVGSDLRLPEALYETLSIYLLLAIGIKGGLELSRQPLADLAPEIAACMALGFAIPFLMYPALRALRLSAADAAALGAHIAGAFGINIYTIPADLIRGRHEALKAALGKD